MKRKTVVFLLFILTLAQPVFAQRRIVEGIQHWRGGGRSVERSAPSLLGIAQEEERLSSLVTNQVTVTERSAREAVEGSLGPGREFASVHLPPEVAKYAHSVFRARPLGVRKELSFSGVVFKTQQGEIFGLVAAHAFSTGPVVNSLEEEFEAELFDKDGFIAVRAKLVQVSATSTLDLALVKFLPADEKLFTPFVLAQEESPVGEELTGLGFGQGKWIITPHRRLLANTPFSLRTSFPVPLDKRGGLCGSAVFNKRGELAGVHVGSTWQDNWWESVGYVTPSRHINALVKAYHHNGNAIFPFYLNGQQITSLRVDESISYVRLKDDKGRVIGRREVKDKFPYNEIIASIPYARYIELSINRMVWTGDYLQRDRLFTRTVTYDLLKQEMVK